MADVLGKKISELAETTDLAGLFTIGSDKNNQSKKVSLQFVKEAADYANAQGDYAKGVGDTIQGNTGMNEYPAFSSSTQYAAGSVVRYNNKLYRFTALHPAGAWVGTDAIETSIKAETDVKLTELESEQGNIFIKGNGETLARTKLSLTPGRRYRLSVINDWTFEDAFNRAKLLLAHTNLEGTSIKDIEIFSNESCEAYYDFWAEDATSRYTLSIRATSGDIVRFYIADVTDISVNVKKSVFSNTLKEVSNNAIELVNINIYDADGKSRTIYADDANHTAKTFEFAPQSAGGLGTALVLTKEGKIEFRQSIATALETDTILLTYYSKNDCFNGGLLLPYLAYNRINKLVGTFAADDAQNMHIAMMNKYAESCGCERSAFLGSYGMGWTCAKDLVRITMSAITSDKLVAAWGLREAYVPVYGQNQRVDYYQNSYTNDEYAPLVADLSKDYFIFGGKTGNDAVVENSRGVVVAAKSKVDETWFVGCVIYAQSNVEGNNRYSMMKKMFDALESKRVGESVTLEKLDCNGAYAVVVPNAGNLNNYNVDFDSLISVGQSELKIMESHSIAKLLSAVVAIENINPNRMITVTSDDDYSGSSGAYFFAGDEISVMDALKATMLTSSSRAIRALARYSGNEVMRLNDGRKIFSFRLRERVAYCYGVTTWYEWVNSPDCQLFTLKNHITITCASENDVVVIDGTEKSYKGSDLITPNGNYY